MFSIKDLQKYFMVKIPQFIYLAQEIFKRQLITNTKCLHKDRYQYSKQMKMKGKVI